MVLTLVTVLGEAFFAGALVFLAVEDFLEVAGFEVADLRVVFAGAFLDFEEAALDLEDDVLFGAAFFGAGFVVADLRAGDLEVFLGAAFLGLEEALEEALLAGTFALGAFFLEDTDGYSSESMATPSTIFGIGSEL